MKIFNFFSAAVLTALVVCGCGDNPLTYVEKSADKVEYGNTERINSEKGVIAQEQALVSSPFLDDMKKLLGDKEVSKLNFRYVRWQEVGKGGDLENVGAVIVANDGNAKDLFDDLRKAYRKDNQNVKKETVNEEYEAFVVTSDPEGKKIIISYTLVDNMIHVVYNDDPKVFKADGENKFANMIDSSADLADAFVVESKTMGDRIEKRELFFTDEEVKLNSSVDITEIKAVDKK